MQVTLPEAESLEAFKSDRRDENLICRTLRALSIYFVILTAHLATSSKTCMLINLY